MNNSALRQWYTYAYVYSSPVAAWKLFHSHISSVRITVAGAQVGIYILVLVDGSG